MCLWVFLLGSNFFGTLWISWISWKPICFARLGQFSFIICSNKFSISFSSYSPSGTHMIQMLKHSKLSRTNKLLLIFLNSCFFICSSWMVISSFCSNMLIWVLICFPSLLFLCIFFFISLCIAFTSSFIFCHTQSFLRASWLPVLWTLHLIGCVSPHHLVLFLEFCSVLSFGPYFFVSAHLLHCKGWSLRYSPGWGNPLCCVVVL